MFKVYAFVIFIIWCIGTKAQNTVTNKRKNIIYVELGGNGFLNSINFERLLNPHAVSNHISARAGVGFYSSSHDSSIITTIPFEISYWPGESNYHAEFGIGYTPSFGHRTFQKDGIVYADKDFDYNILVRGGVRYQKEKVMFRCAITPVIYRDYFNKGKLKITPWAGIALGYVF